jgi:hypothetical protein
MHGVKARLRKSARTDQNVPGKAERRPYGHRNLTEAESPPGRFLHERHAARAYLVAARFLQFDEPSALRRAPPCMKGALQVGSLLRSGHIVRRSYWTTQ